MDKWRVNVVRLISEVYGLSTVRNSVSHEAIAKLRLVPRLAAPCRIAPESTRTGQSPDTYLISKACVGDTCWHAPCLVSTRNRRWGSPISLAVSRGINGHLADMFRNGHMISRQITSTHLAESHLFAPVPTSTCIRGSVSRCLC